MSILSKITQSVGNWKIKLEPYGVRLNRKLGGVPGIIHTAMRDFSRDRSPEAASSLAFWGVFSLFPLLAVLVTVISLIVPTEDILRVLIQILSPVFPVSRSLIEENLERLIEMRGAFGILGTLSLMWSSSSVFMTLMTQINRAWEHARIRHFLQRRLIALGIVALILLLLVLSLFFTTALDILTSLRITGMEWLAVDKASLFLVIGYVAPPLISFLTFFLIYRWLPNTAVRNVEAFWGALIVAIAWEITASLFGWAIDQGIFHYDVIYGSLGAVTILMLWFYLNSIILLFGANLSASIAEHTQRRTKKLLQEKPDVLQNADDDR